MNSFFCRQLTCWSFSQLIRFSIFNHMLAFRCSSYQLRKFFLKSTYNKTLQTSSLLFKCNRNFITIANINLSHWMLIIEFYYVFIAITIFRQRKTKSSISSTSILFKSLKKLIIWRIASKFSVTEKFIQSLSLFNWSLRRLFDRIHLSVFDLRIQIPSMLKKIRKTWSHTS